MAMLIEGRAVLSVMYFPGNRFTIAAACAATVPITISRHCYIEIAMVVALAFVMIIIFACIPITALDMPWICVVAKAALILVYMF